MPTCLGIGRVTVLSPGGVYQLVAVRSRGFIWLFLFTERDSNLGGLDLFGNLWGSKVPPVLRGFAVVVSPCV